MISGNLAEVKEVRLPPRKVRYLGNVITPGKLQVAEDAMSAFASG